ncbi:transposase (plasmid) [Piscirickettsia salmonis]|uniref:Transposase n=1 Tax=Piscirickettsia salmonis TaxID=1238 RepID=A0AAC8VLF3_PISSA|nr:helix-turn-helix domain-containing protein [Piscirickettsia salmonis]ALB24698.1 transposase [Piscirickettsia salmonis]APS75336.1 hypothetical protein AVM70_17370 [Piscirickettsia salmonis]
MKKIVLYRTTVIRGDSLRSIARALGFSPSTISREIKRHTPIDFKVFIVTGLLLAAHKKNELTLSKDKLFDKFQKRQKC